MFRYTVSCAFTDATVADRWLAWLVEGHLADVVEAGALGAEVVRLDGEPLTLEAHYLFADRAAFTAYEAEHADRLRSEGLALFPLSLGLSYTRRTGEVRGTAEGYGAPVRRPEA